jgi:sugar phosphate isomerase/epimerase
MALGICTATVMVDPLAATEADIRTAGEALVAAGVTDASVWTFHIPALASLDLHIEVVEAASGWAHTTAAEAAAEAEQIAQTAKAVGASKIAAITLEPGLPDLDHARDNLALLVAAATDVGAQVCIEFLPWTGIPDLATAWELVEPLGPGAGILLDSWHWVRQPGGPDFELLARIPGERIGYVQLCDAAAAPSGDVMTEAMAHRLLPGDGVVDFTALLDQLASIGARPFFATEIFNSELVSRHGADGAAGMMAAAARPLVT